MPMYLKKDAIRFLESSIETICTAINSLGMPERIELKNDMSRNSTTIGLIGIAAELAMDSILVQANGIQSLIQHTGYYKTAGQIVDDLNKLLKGKNLKISFLIKDVENPEKMLEELTTKVQKFKVLMPLRASGVHAGIGVSRDVCIVAINDVIEFLNLISNSSRIKPYTNYIPKKIEIIKQNQLIIDELIEKIKNGRNLVEKVNALASVYMVTPELPENSENWMNSFEKIMISPKADDITFLIDTLKQSKYASLVKVSGDDLGLPVVIDPNNPSALSIEPQFLKKSFTKIKDRFLAATRIANGRLDEKILEVPPIDSVHEIFTFKFEKLNIELDNKGTISYMDIWPVICSSLTYSGTMGPIWYFIKKCDDLNQLKSCLKRALNTGDTKLNKNYKKIEECFESMFNKVDIDIDNEYVKVLISLKNLADIKREKMRELINRQVNTTKEFSELAMTDFNKYENEEINLGDIIISLLDDKYGFNEKDKMYWVKNLCEAITEEDELEGLLAVLKNKKMKSIHTVVRKSIQMIDFVNYGPSIKMNNIKAE